MNETALFKSVNLEITKYLNNHLPVFFDDFDDENYLISFAAVSVILPKAMLQAEVDNLRDSEGKMKNMFNEVQNDGGMDFEEIQKISKDYFIGTDTLYYVKDFGNFKGMTFENCVTAIVNNTRWLVLKDGKNKPYALLLCARAYLLTSEKLASKK